jgi:hypothetical protein
MNSRARRNLPASPEKKRAILRQTSVLLKKFGHELVCLKPLAKPLWTSFFAETASSIPTVTVRQIHPPVPGAARGSLIFDV